MELKGNLEQQLKALRIPEVIEDLTDLREEKRKTQNLATKIRRRKRIYLFCSVLVTILLIIAIFAGILYGLNHSVFNQKDLRADEPLPAVGLRADEPGSAFDTPVPEELKLLSTLLLTCLLSLMGFIEAYKIKSHSLEQANLRIIKFDELIFLKEINSSSPEEKALRQLLERTTKLDTYYEINIGHMRKVFRWGIAIICIGIAITLTFVVYMLINPQNVDLAVSISGFLSGLLVDAIGAIFILMYSKTMESANAYEKGLAASATNHLGSLIASRIEDPSTREKALAEIARELVKAKPSQSEKS